MDSITFTGNLVAGPHLSRGETGKFVCLFTVQVIYLSEDGLCRDWYRVRVRGQLAKQLQKTLRKHSEVWIQGHIPEDGRLDSTGVVVNALPFGVACMRPDVPNYLRAPVLAGELIHV